MMRLSAVQLREASAEDLEAYAIFASDPSSWAVYYATVRATARIR